MKAKYSALQVAHWFILRNQTMVDDMDAEKMTLLKLLKLLYYAEGCHLALNDGNSLFEEKILAWEHGPVVEEIYREYDNPYELPIPETSEIKAEDKHLLEQVFQVFGKYSAWALRNKTHEELPWLEATKNGQHFNEEISRKTMEYYFKKHYIDI